MRFILKSILLSTSIRTRKYFFLPRIYKQLPKVKLEFQRNQLNRTNSEMNGWNKSFFADQRSELLRKLSRAVLPHRILIQECRDSQTFLLKIPSTKEDYSWLSPQTFADILFTSLAEDSTSLSTPHKVRYLELNSTSPRLIL